MPEDMPEHMPEDMPDRMPNRMSEDMSDRMPEDLPVRKCINVMVGITRSKVFFWKAGLVIAFTRAVPKKQFLRSRFFFFRSAWLDPLQCEKTMFRACIFFGKAGLV